MSSAFSDNPQFAHLLAGREDEVDLVRLMLEFATDVYPGLDVQQPLAELDRLGQSAREAATDADGDVASGCKRSASCCMGKKDFAATRIRYYDPRNSYLNDVLDRRLGIPISLAIVYTAVGRQAGLDLFGVGSPGHFMVGCRRTTANAVHRPLRFRRRFRRTGVPRADRARAGATERIVERAPSRRATPREIAARVLRNLKAAYAMRDVWREAYPSNCGWWLCCLNCPTRVATWG